MEVKSRKYTVGTEEFLFRANMRANIEFERRTGEPVKPTDNMEKNLLYLYCGTVAGMSKAKLDFTYTFDEFIDLLDDDFAVLERLMKEEAADRSQKATKNIDGNPKN